MKRRRFIKALAALPFIGALPVLASVGRATATQAVLNPNMPIGTVWIDSETNIACLMGDQGWENHVVLTPSHTRLEVNGLGTYGSVVRYGPTNTMIYAPRAIIQKGPPE